MKTIVFDLDDTIADLKEPLCAALNKHTGKNMHWSDWEKFNVENYYGIPGEDLLKIIINDKLLETMEPFPETKGLLTDLVKKGYNVTIITSRSYHPDAMKVTATWFTKYDIPFTRLVVSGHGKKKSDYILEEEKVGLFVDDRIENCEEFIASGKANTVRLFDTPWNKQSPLARVDNLSQVRALLNV